MVSRDEQRDNYKNLEPHLGSRHHRRPWPGKDGTSSTIRKLPSQVHIYRSLSHLDEETSSRIPHPGGLGERSANLHCSPRRPSHESSTADQYLSSQASQASQVPGKVLDSGMFNFSQPFHQRVKRVKHFSKKWINRRHRNRENFSEFA